MPPAYERDVPIVDRADADPLLAPTACNKGNLEVALVIPLQGPAGMFGPACALSARLAAEHINSRGGLMGRELRLVIVDGGAPLTQVAQEVDQLVTNGLVEAVTGWHISAVRQVLVTTLRGRVPYVYTPLYEGGERHPGVFLTGETPERHMEPAMRWLSNEFGIQRWCIVGNDYVWPRSSAESAYSFTRQHRSNICTETYVPLGSTDFRGVLERVERSGAQGVLQLLVGEDAVHFNRAFAAAGLDEHAVRFSPLMDENMLLAGGVESSRSLYSSAGFFEGLATQGSLDIVGLYAERFGMCAPVLSSLGESCYEGVLLLAALVEQAGSLGVPDLMRVADTVGFDGPRGAVYMRDRHLVQDIHLAHADGLEFDVIASF
jgi:urea transport system substrate-binding protein